MRYRWILLFGVFLAGFVGAAPACPFCSMQGTTLTGEVEQASMVLYGRLKEPTLSAGGAEGTTKLEIISIIKNHDWLGDKKVVVLPRYIPSTDKEPIFYLVFCDLYKDKIDPYRGFPVSANSDMVKYLQGAVAVAKEKDVGKRLRFFFDYLDNPDVEIANDAYKEFGNSEYKDFRTMAKDLPADRVIKWLRDPNTPSFRLGLYGSMLGHCGKEGDADVLLKLLEASDRRNNTGIDGILAGYVMLRPKRGWTYLRDTLADKDKDFPRRYAALRAARFFWDSRTDVIDKKEIVSALELLLDQGDIADLAIEDLRKWGQWGPVDRVLALYGKETHDVPIVRRAILRYALSCPSSDNAKQFVDTLRKKDPDLVRDAEELLKLEAPPSANGNS